VWLLAAPTSIVAGWPPQEDEMEKVIVTYKLKPGVTIEQYEAWSKDVDQPVTGGQPGFKRFEVFAVQNRAGEAESNVEVFEDIEIESWELFNEVISAPNMEYIVETFPLVADPDSMVILHGRRIYSTLPNDARPPIPAVIQEPAAN
jgi:hypothetical protein